MSDKIKLLIEAIEALEQDSLGYLEEYDQVIEDVEDAEAGMSGDDLYHLFMKIDPSGDYDNMFFSIGYVTAIRDAARMIEEVMSDEK